MFRTTSIIILIFSLFTKTSLSQNNTIIPEQLNFSFAKEKELFTTSDSISADEFFYLASFSSEIEKQESIARNKDHFDKWLATYYRKINKKTNRHDKVEYLLKKANKELFNRYAENSNFNSLIKEHYSESTGINFLAYALGKLKIEFTLTESMLGGMLLIESNNQNYFVVSDDRNDFIMLTDQQLQQLIISSKIRANIISEREEKLLSPELLANYITSTKHTITYKKFASWLYFEQSAILFNEQDYKTANSKALKAYYLNPIEPFKNIITGSCAQIIDNNENSIDLVQYWATFINFAEKENGKEICHLYFDQQFNQIMKFKFKEENFIIITDSLYKSVNGSACKKYVKFRKNYILASYYSNRSKPSKAEEYLQKAVDIMPNDTVTVYEYSNLVLVNFGYNHSAKKGLKKLETIEKEYPLVRLNSRFTESLLYYYLYNSHEYFTANNSKQAEIYIKKFEKDYDPDMENLKNTGVIGKAYSSGVMYYFRAKRISKAKTFGKRGLKFDPENRELKYKLQLINYEYN